MNTWAEQVLTVKPRNEWNERNANMKQVLMDTAKMFTKMTAAERLDRVNFCLEQVHLEGVNKKFPAEIWHTEISL